MECEIIKMNEDTLRLHAAEPHETIEQNDGSYIDRKLIGSKAELYNINNPINLWVRYDGFNKLMFVYLLVIPKWKEEKYFILPSKWKQIAHRSWVLIYSLPK